MGEVEWDSPLSDELLLKWKKITSELNCLEEVMVPRCYLKFNSPCQVIQIHGFCNASERAFAAVVYMRSVYEDGHGQEFQKGYSSGYKGGIWGCNP